MLAEAKSVYLATRKKHDQLFNTYFMRPVAAWVVTLLARTPLTPNQVTLLSVFFFVVAAGLLVALPSFVGGLVAVAVVELSYMFDCADGMLARHRGIASQQGHLFDFFTDDLKAVLLVGGLGIHLWQTGGTTPWLDTAPPGSQVFLLAAIGGVIVVASALSLTNFVRRPEISGRETPVQAHYESVEHHKETSLVRRAAGLVVTFLQFLGHYPSHLWVWALLGRLDLFFWVYIAINLLYLGKGWLGLILRFGRGN